MKNHYLLVAITVLLSGCISKGVKYNNQWSKAKNLTNAAGMQRQIHDQQLPAAAYNKQGQLLDYQLNSITHPAYGSSSDGPGINILPYGAFEHFYWGWSVSGASHRSEHRLFAWMPEAMAAEPLQARNVLENLIVKTAQAILKEMHYNLQPVKAPYRHLGVAFRQWYLERPDGHCTFKQMNCVFSVYVPEPLGKASAPAFSFYSTAGQRAWLFPITDEYRYPRVALSQGDGLKTMAENIFYQQLSARLPGWIYLYLAPGKVGIGEHNRTISYPYLLEKGRPLLFVRPTK